MNRPKAFWAVCLVAVTLAACGQRESADDSVGDQTPPQAAETVPAGAQEVSYLVSATATSSTGNGGKPETFSTSYELDVSRTDADGQFFLDMSMRLKTRPEAWSWVDDEMPGTWRRTYRTNGEFLSGRTDPYAAIFNNMTHGLYSVSHLVLRLPSMKLEPGSTWQSTEQQPTGRVRFHFEVIDLNDSTISIRSTATLTPFTDEDDFSWEETVEGQYDRSSLLANSLTIERRKDLEASLTRQESDLPVALSETTELHLERTGA